jgi:hypothetical protein
MATFITSSRFILSLIILIFVLNSLALYSGWYTTTNPIDKLYHVLGGFWLGALLFYLRRVWAGLIVFSDSFWGRMIAVLAAAALVGLGWEFFEFGIDTLLAPPGTHIAQGDLVDTMGDLAGDLFGAFIFALLYTFGSREQKKAP